MIGHSHLGLGGLSSRTGLAPDSAPLRQGQTARSTSPPPLHLMHPSTQTLALALATLAIGGVQGLKFHRRADPVDTSSTQGAQNLLITNAEQTLFYTPMQFGSGDRSVNIYGLVSTTR